jgi:hypothetical protein
VPELGRAVEMERKLKQMQTTKRNEFISADVNYGTAANSIRKEETRDKIERGWIYTARERHRIKATAEASGKLLLVVTHL